MVVFLIDKFFGFKGKKVVVVMCGGNIDMSMFGKVFECGLVSDGRFVRFACVVFDRSGGIVGVCNKIVDVGVLIKYIVYECVWLD